MGMEIDALARQRGYTMPWYPNGWFRVADSVDLREDEVKRVHYFGRDLVMFRGSDGSAGVFDAHCPHLGAHLGYGGRVEDGVLRCPFHGWRYDVTGRCVGIDYSRRIPKGVRLSSWPVCEKNGVILVWHHDRGEPPSWDVPDIADWGAPGWSEPLYAQYIFEAHRQELTENIVDDAHFQTLHGTKTIPRPTVETRDHVLRAYSLSEVQTSQGMKEMGLEILAYGIGFGYTRFTGIVETLNIVSGAPIDPGVSEGTICLMVRQTGENGSTSELGQRLLAEIKRQFEIDIPIFNHKVFRPKPPLCDGDGAIAKMRRWAEQFYSTSAAAPDAEAMAAERPGQRVY